MIRIRAAAFNPIDYQMRKCSSESKLLKSPIPGRELSGDVVQLGREVNSFRIGDKVSAYAGSLDSAETDAEFISVPARLVARFPQYLTFERAAAY